MSFTILLRFIFVVLLVTKTTLAQDEDPEGQPSGGGDVSSKHYIENV